jgi:hypothetical protein
MVSKLRFAALVAAASVFSIASSPAQESRANDHLAAATSIEFEALSVIARRTNAYNDHDIEAFLATYDENVRIYEYPDKLLGEGTERMRRIFGPQFAENDGLIIVHAAHGLENTVVSDETVSFYGNSEHNIGIYTVRDGLIVEVRLIEPAE